MSTAGVFRCQGTSLWKSCKHLSYCARRYRHSSEKRTLPQRNHYEVLQVRPNASKSQIRAAFVQLSKEIHPDKNPSDPENHDKFVQLNEAYTVLSRPISRREYDVSLARRLHHRQHMARHGYGSHTAGETHHPGSGTAQGSNDGFSERVFWDETIWYMRDRSKDASAHYRHHSYYGIKGVRRLPNSYVLAGCVSLMIIGTIGFALAIRWSARKRQETLELIDKKNLAVLEAARSRARALGTAKQLEIMTAKWSNNSNTGSPPRE